MGSRSKIDLDLVPAIKRPSFPSMMEAVESISIPVPCANNAGKGKHSLCDTVSRTKVERNAIDGSSSIKDTVQHSHHSKNVNVGWNPTSERLGSVHDKRPKFVNENVGKVASHVIVASRPNNLYSHRKFKSLANLTKTESLTNNRIHKGIPLKRKMKPSNVKETKSKTKGRKDSGVQLDWSPIKEPTVPVLRPSPGNYSKSYNVNSKRKRKDSDSIKIQTFKDIIDPKSNDQIHDESLTKDRKTINDIDRSQVDTKEPGERSGIMAVDSSEESDQRTQNATHEPKPSKSSIQHLISLFTRSSCDSDEVNSQGDYIKDLSPVKQIPSTSFVKKISPTVNQVPVTSPVNQVPVTSPVNQLPITSPVNQVPVTSPVNKVPVTSPVNQVPVTSTVNQVSVTSTVNQVPVTSTVNQVPVTSPVNQVSVTSPVKQISVTSPVKQVSVTSPVKQVSVTSPVKQVSSNIPSSCRPINQLSTTKTIIIYNSNEPIVKRPLVQDKTPDVDLGWHPIAQPSFPPTLAGPIPWNSKITEPSFPLPDSTPENEETKPVLTRGSPAAEYVKHHDRVPPVSNPSPPKQVPNPITSKPKASPFPTYSRVSPAAEYVKHPNHVPPMSNQNPHEQVPNPIMSNPKASPIPTYSRVSPAAEYVKRHVSETKVSTQNQSKDQENRVFLSSPPIASRSPVSVVFNSSPKCLQGSTPIGQAPDYQVTQKTPNASQSEDERPSKHLTHSRPTFTNIVVSPAAEYVKRHVSETKVSIQNQSKDQETRVFLSSPPIATPSTVSVVFNSSPKCLQGSTPIGQAPDSQVMQKTPNASQSEDERPSKHVTHSTFTNIVPAQFPESDPSSAITNLVLDDTLDLTLKLEPIESNLHPKIDCSTEEDREQSDPFTSKSKSILQRFVSVFRRGPPNPSITDRTVDYEGMSDDTNDPKSSKSTIQECVSLFKRKLQGRDAVHSHAESERMAVNDETGAKGGELAKVPVADGSDKGTQNYKSDLSIELDPRVRHFMTVVLSDNDDATNEILPQCPYAKRIQNDDRSIFGQSENKFSDESLVMSRIENVGHDPRARHFSSAVLFDDTTTDYPRSGHLCTNNN